MNSKNGALIVADRIVRSRRRTLSLEIVADGRLVVRAPSSASGAVIERFIREKASWIGSKQRLARLKAREAAPKRFIAGEAFLYKGERFPLVLTDDPRPPLTLDSGAFRLSNAHLHHPDIVFTNWYRLAAARVIGERLEFYAALTGIRYRGFRVTGARRRWGSCSALGKLSFSWRLVMAPVPVIDYVVCHELAHIAEPNHSRRFWKQVAALFPGYREARSWLTAHGHLLTIGGSAAD